MPILLFQKLIPYYRIKIFEDLNKDLGIITCHSKGLKGSSNKSFHYMLEFVNEVLPAMYYERKETSLIQNVFPVLRKYKPEIVISEFSYKYLTFWLLLFVRIFFGFKLVIWGHGISNRDQDSKPLKTFRSRINNLIYRRADALIVYSPGRAALLKEHIDPRKIFVASNTMDLEKNIKICNSLTIVGKEKLRKKLGFKEKFHLVYCGRLTSNKRLDLLIELFKILKQKCDVALHIIGTGPEINILKVAEKEVGSIYLYGEIYDELEAGELIFASDLMVITGAVGLSILHAFSLSIPLVAFKSDRGYPAHGPEIELLKDKDNGLLCEQNCTIMADCVYRLLSDKKVLEIMSGNALLTAQASTIENMLTGFHDAIEFVRNFEGG